MLNRVSGIFIGIFLTLFSFGLVIPATQAQESPTAGAATTAVLDPSNIVTFDQLSFTGQTLRGPSDSARLFLSLPADWQLLPGTQVELDTLVFISSEALSTGLGVYGGSIEVEFNDIVIGDIPLTQNGPATFTFTVPDIALDTTRIDGRFPLQITLRGDHVCDFERNVNVVLLPTSRFLLPHTTIAPNTDLTQLPRPIYQRSFLPDEAVIVLPQNPTAGELQAAFTVAAGLGKTTGSTLLLTTVPLNELTPQDQSSKHLILVGKAEGFSGLTELLISPPPAVGEADGNGLLQMVVSPWNPAKVVLIITGSNDAATIKAAQAFSSGTIRTGGQRSTAIVEAVDTNNPTVGSPDTDRTFTELGYGSPLLQGRGTDQTDLEFVLPDGQTIADSDEATINLIFSHSALLDYARSGISVILNDEPVGSVRFSDETTNLGSYTVRIPITAVRPGRNHLQLRAELVPLRSCNDLGAAAWLAIRPESWLHLPLAPAQKPDANTFTLSQYPDPFTLDTTLGTTAIIVPPNDTRAWNIAIKLAFDLGNRASGTLTTLRAAYADNIPADLRSNYDLLLVGQARALPLLGELNESLPAPFASDSDRVVDEKLPVDFLVPPDVTLGYLQLLPTPWNSEHAIMTVLGDSPAGVEQALNALFTSSQRTQLASNFAVIEAERLFVAPPDVDAFAQVPSGTEVASTEDTTPGITAETVITGTETITTTAVSPTAAPTETVETAVTSEENSAASQATPANEPEQPQFSINDQLAESGPILAADPAQVPAQSDLFSRWVWMTIVAISVIVLLILILIRFRQ